MNGTAGSKNLMAAEGEEVDVKVLKVLELFIKEDGSSLFLNCHWTPLVVLFDWNYKNL